MARFFFGTSPVSSFLGLLGRFVVPAIAPLVLRFGAAFNSWSSSAASFASSSLSCLSCLTTDFVDGGDARTFFRVEGERMVFEDFRLAGTTGFGGDGSSSSDPCSSLRIIPKHSRIRSSRICCCLDVERVRTHLIGGDIIPREFFC